MSSLKIIQNVKWRLSGLKRLLNIMHTPLLSSQAWPGRSAFQCGPDNLSEILNWKSCKERITFEIQKTLCIFLLIFLILFLCSVIRYSLCVCPSFLRILLDNDIISTVRRSFRNIKIKVIWGGKNIIFWLRYCCLVTKSCPTLCDPMGCSLPGSSFHRISQTRILEWIAIAFSRGSSRLKDPTHVSCIGRQILHQWVTR